MGFPYLVSDAVEFSKTCGECEVAHDVDWTCKCVSPANSKPRFHSFIYEQQTAFSVYGFLGVIIPRGMMGGML